MPGARSSSARTRPSRASAVCTSAVDWTLPVADAPPLPHPYAKAEHLRPRGALQPRRRRAAAAYVASSSPATLHAGC